MNRKKMIITGASSGVGMSLVKFFSGQMDVIAIARRIDRMQEHFADLRNVTCYKCDLSKVEEIISTIEKIKIEHGFIGYLINNAGVNKYNLFTDLTNEDFEISMAVNFMAPIITMKCLLPEMIENNFGRIINITSGAPLNNFDGYSAYSASKGALNSVTLTVAKEIAQKNIKVNLMSPGPVKSEMAPNMSTDPSVCHPTADYLINLTDDGETGGFFWLGHKVPMFSDLSDTQWLNGIPGKNLIKIL
jgi:3-oxoacyl-[acyl-carrier protein] reductase